MELDKYYQRTALLCVAGLAGILILLPIYLFVVPSIRSGGAEPSVVLRAFFLGAGLVIALALPLLRKWMMTDKFPFGDHEMHHIPHPLRGLVRTSIVTSAFCEMIALLGLVHAFLGGSGMDFYLLWGGALVLSGIYFPRKSAWREKVSPNDRIIE